MQEWSENVSKPVNVIQHISKIKNKNLTIISMDEQNDGQNLALQKLKK